MLRDDLGYVLSPGYGAVGNLLHCFLLNTSSKPSWGYLSCSYIIVSDGRLPNEYESCVQHVSEKDCDLHNHNALSPHTLTMDLLLFQIDIFQMNIIEFLDRPGNPLYHLEHFIEGEYIKYNSNSGFVDTHHRLTPQVGVQKIVDSFGCSCFDSDKHIQSVVIFALISKDVHACKAFFFCQVYSTSAWRPKGLTGYLF